MLQLRALFGRCSAQAPISNRTRSITLSNSLPQFVNGTSSPGLAAGIHAIRMIHATPTSLETADIQSQTGRRTICIKNIPRTVSPARLKYHFGTFGEIEQVDRPIELTPMGDRLSTKYAFIRFAEPQAAKEALGFNKTHAFGSLIHVELAKAEAKIREGANEKGDVIDTGPNSRTVIVFNLHKDVDDARLGSVFSLFGKVEDVHRGFDQRKQRQANFAFIRFTDTKSATEALSMDGMKIHGRTVFVERKIPESETDTDSSAKATIAVRNCGPQTDLNKIRSMFEKCGGILGVWRAPKGTGVNLQFATPQGAEKALGLDGSDFEGNSLGVVYAQKQIPLQNPTRTLSLSKLPSGTSEDSLRTAFSSFGEITAIHIPVTVSTGEPRSISLIQFKDVNTAKRAFEGAANMEFMGVKLRVAYGRYTQKQTEPTGAVETEGLPTASTKSSTSGS